MASDDTAKRAKASRRLRATDALAESVVTIGGFSVLAAVLGICVYLAWVVVPLFASGSVGSQSPHQIRVVSEPENLFVGPYSNLGVLVHPDASVEVFALDGGNAIGTALAPDDNTAPSAIATARNGELFAAGYPDGAVRLGSILFETSLLRAGDTPDPSLVGSGTLLEDGRTRFVEVRAQLGEPIELSEGSGPVTHIDHRVDPTGKKTLVAMREDGTVIVASIRVIRPLGGGAPRTQLRQTAFRIDDPSGVAAVHGTSDGDNVFVVRSSGSLERYSRESRAFVFRERVALTQSGETITSIEMLFGGKTLLAADSDGYVQSWHVHLDESDRFGDRAALTRSHRFRISQRPIVDITPSARDRSVLLVDDSGSASLRHMTSEKLVIALSASTDGIALGAIGPRNDSVVLMNPQGAYELARYEEGYPGFGFKALFGRVHYEGLAEPEYVYQSSAGSDSAETKLNLMPLIFGTLKATVFAMLFAVPLGVLAAVYSSEFLSKRVRRVVKPTVEMMASLPSVVLGFVAAIVVAPFVSAHLPSFLSALLIVPIVLLGAAHVWQLVPVSTRRRFGTGHHLALVLVSLGAGFGVSFMSGPAIERVFFAPDRVDLAVLSGALEPLPEPEVPGWYDESSVRDRRLLRESGTPLMGGTPMRVVEEFDTLERAVRPDIRRWLNSEYGKGASGWVFVFFPLTSLGVWLVQARLVRRLLDERLIDTGPVLIGGVAILKFIVCVVLSLGLSVLLSHTLAGFGHDPRDSVFGPFSPRNTFVVALIMGFAVIPIIFTIAEDALQSVPPSLRTASLGAGATPWQTATRVVLPVAASGIFSGVMIGFGRAVGETMIVLMATGNTPDISWNLFSGFRTLAANIAVELPEAPKDSTHYRVLFLCGFVLFVMTFVINTSAELVRRWVRSRNAGL